MKNLLTLAAGLFTLSVMAQTPAQNAPADKATKSETLAIQSTAICDMCEKTIETEMIYEKGVKKVDVDLTTAQVHVEYDAKKTEPAALRAALVKLGYSADGTPGDEKAFAKLPLCCQNEGCGKLPAKE